MRYYYSLILSLLLLWPFQPGITADVAHPSIQVKKQQEISLKPIHIINLAPNGKWIAGFHLKKKLLVIYDLETKKNLWESPPREQGYDYPNMRWSPDGRYLAFTEDWARSMYDSDIWLLDTQDWSLKNLTDDGFQGNMLKIPKNANVDCCPAWNKENTQLVFVRNAPHTSSMFYRIRVTGGKPEKLCRATGGPMGLWLGPWLDSRSERIYYTQDLPNGTKVANGIWGSDLMGNVQTHYLSADKEKAIPYLLQYSSKTGKSIVAYLQYIYRLKKNDYQNSFYLWDAGTITFTPIIPGNINNDEKGVHKRNYRITQVVLAPSGKRIVMLCRASNHWNYLIMRDLITGDEKILFQTQDEVIGIPLRPGMTGLWWEHDSIVVSSDPIGSSVYWLTLETGK